MQKIPSLNVIKMKTKIFFIGLTIALFFSMGMVAAESNMTVESYGDIASETTVNNDYDNFIGQENVYSFTPEKTGYYCIEGAFEPGKFYGKSVNIATYEEKISGDRWIFEGVVSEYLRTEDGNDIYSMYFSEDGSLQGGTTYYLVLSFEEDLGAKSLRIVETDIGVEY